MLDSEAADRLFAFLHAFERGGFASADAHYHATGRPPTEVTELIRAIYDSGLVRREFHWIAWKGEARRYTQEPGLIAAADLKTLQRLLTISVRQDRFVGGLMCQLCSSGFLQAVLDRLARLRNPGSGQSEA